MGASSGYPRGLGEEQIPLAARAFAVVDVYDVLTHDRPYRAAWSPDKALAHIDGLAGVHFDPEIVVALHRALGPGIDSGPLSINRAKRITPRFAKQIRPSHGDRKRSHFDHGSTNPKFKWRN
jgi:hypothetical protein